MKTSRLATILHDGCLNNKSRTFLRIRRRLMPFIANVPVVSDYFGKKIVFPMHHDLVYLTSLLPLYNVPLRQLAKTIRDHERHLGFIDIGANIGDGIALVDPQPDDRIWLIEGSKEYLPYLKENSKGLANVKIIEAYLAEEAKVTAGAEIIENATARIDMAAKGSIVFETLDNIFASLPQGVSMPNLLKIDVEGHEPKIFRGGLRFLQQARPVIFMEWHQKLLKKEAFDPMILIDLLTNLGYTKYVVYDNTGYLLGFYGANERSHFSHLSEYARAKDGFYFDVAAFPETSSVLWDNYCRTEIDRFSVMPDGLA